MAPRSLKKLNIIALAVCMLGSLGMPQRREDRLRDTLAPVLTTTGGAARLYFAGQCDPYPQFPHLTLAEGSDHATGLEATREIFANQRDAVVEDRSGIVKITIGVVPTALLSTKIARLTLDPIARWNPAPAIQAIENTAEVKATMRRLNVEPPRLSVIDWILTGPGNNRFPHLPHILENVTMDQALDAVAKSFKQLVIYGECTQPNGRGTISVYFTPLTECDSHLRGNPCFVPEAKIGWPTPLELSPDPSLSPHTRSSGGSQPPIGAPGAMPQSRFYEGGDFYGSR